jgi:hypothetical protein
VSIVSGNHIFSPITTLKKLANHLGNLFSPFFNCRELRTYIASATSAAFGEVTSPQRQNQNGTIFEDEGTFV